MKNAILIALGCLFPWSSGFAMPALDLAQEQVINRLHSQGNHPVAQRQCADFSGEWKGTCSVDGKTVPSNLQIVQASCESVVINGEDTGVNGLKSYSAASLRSGNSYAAAGVSSATWNAAGTEHSIFLNGQVRALGQTALFPINMVLNMRLEAGKLVIDADMLSAKIKCEHVK